GSQVVCSFTVTVLAAQLSLKKTGPTCAKVGDSLTWTIIVRNVGTMAAQDVLLSDALTPMKNVSACLLTQLSGPKFTVTQASSCNAAFTASIKSLLPSENAVFQFKCCALSAGTISNTSVVTSSNTTSETSAVTTTVACSK